MNAHIRSLSGLTHVDAALNYLAPMAERPRNYACEPPVGVPRSNTAPETHRVPIYDARPIASDVSLDREGFALLGHETAMRDFWDDDELRQVYYPEAEAAIAQATGAARVFIFDHTRRKHVPGADDRTAGVPRQPATRVHVDHTAKSGPQRVRDLLGDEAEELLRGRVQVINLWRPIRGPLHDAPLAVCDASSVAPVDLVPADLVYVNRTGETYAVTYNPSHRWFFVPAMQR
ncbi:MAG TPA: CmcJ/NvfI family oxidoreductase, partial [Stellaceae bacterium]|nr:CmcJ/NvfI family oxidoreductase [Stellaceae bacterium]